MRPTYAEIDLRAIHHNLKQVRKQVGKHPQIMAVVKANAYGHGMIPVAKSILKEKLASYLGVAIVEEGVTLRQNGIEAPVLVLTAPPEPQLALFVETQFGSDALLHFDCTETRQDCGRLGEKSCRSCEGRYRHGKDRHRSERYDGFHQ